MDFATHNGNAHPVNNRPKLSKSDLHESESNSISQSKIDKIKNKKITMKQFNESGAYLEDEVRRRSDKKGGHFFDKDAMRFFSSRVSELMWQKGDVKNYQTNPIYFITSEQDRGHIQHAGSVRAFTVRKADADGNIDTVGEFQGHATLGDARKEIQSIIGMGAN